MAQRYQALKRHVVFLIVLIDLFSGASLSCAASPDKTYQEIQQIFDELNRSHGLNLVWEGVDPFKERDLEFDQISPGDLPRFLSFLRVFKEEINRYPAGFFKPSRLPAYPGRCRCH